MTYVLSLYRVLSCSMYSTPKSTSDPVTTRGSFTCFINSEMCRHQPTQKCDLIEDIPSRLCERKRLVHFITLHLFFFLLHISVLEKEIDDPGVALLINHSKIIRVMKFIFYLISQHTHQSENVTVICAQKKKKMFQAYLAMWPICCVW